MVIDKGRMSVADLAGMTGVSEVTIRQDLNSLEKNKATCAVPTALRYRWIVKTSKPG